MATEIQSDSTGAAHNNCLVKFDKGVYSVNAIKKAAYKFAADFSVNIKVTPTEIECSITFDEGVPQPDRHHILQAFNHEVLDQDLRERIAEETKPIRNIILAAAFSKTSLLQEE